MTARRIWSATIPLRSGFPWRTAQPDENVAVTAFAAFIVRTQ
jgi:hypothetical protein